MGKEKFEGKTKVNREGGPKKRGEGSRGVKSSEHELAALFVSYQKPRQKHDQQRMKRGG